MFRGEARTWLYAGPVHLGLIALVVSEYDPAISFFVGVLGVSVSVRSTHPYICPPR
jgi:hypothetical protein